MRAGRSARPWLKVRSLGDDERGSFMVLEAILVALLVLTAILFFTSVQRPSTGTDQGGLDLAQVSADTLAILQVRTFNGDSFDTWITELAQGESATSCVATNPTAAACPQAVAIEDFLGEVLPTGARYSLRIDNGVSSLPVLPLGSTQEPHSGRAAQTVFLPAWDAYASQTVVTDSAAPGESLTRTDHAVLSRFTDPDDLLCIKAPTGGSLTLGSKGPGAVSWVSLWQAAAASSMGATVAGGGATTVASTAGLEVGMHVQGTGDLTSTIQSITDGTTFVITPAPSTGAKTLTFTHNRIPAEALYGTWAGYTDASCTAGATYAKVWSPRFRTVSGVTASALGTLTCSSACFTAMDVGLPVIGPGIASGTRITAVTSTTVATVSPAPSAGSVQVQLPAYSPYAPYGLRLVVWFGA
jgi:hypothetical protein